MFSEPYYAPVPQVDRGHSGHLGAGVPFKVKEVPKNISHLKEKDSAHVHFIRCNFPCLCQIFIAQSICYIELGKTMKHSSAVKKNLEEDSETLVNCNSTLVN